MDEENAATLMAVLSERGGTSLRRLLPGWDMIQVNVPSREEIEGAAGVLVGSGLAEVDESWTLRLTAEGARLRRVVPRDLGMREVPHELRRALEKLALERADLVLPAERYDAAYAEHLERSQRRARRRLRPTWAFWR